jgi:polyisoprenoid-binding protein YceI
MKKILSIAAVVAVLGIALVAFKPAEVINAPKVKSSVATKWTLDKAHTNVLFSVSHLVVSDVEGKFKSFDGWMESDKADFSDAKIGFTVDIASISTDNDMRDNHLKSDDFFNAAKFPQMKFESTSFTSTGGNKYKLTGNLTIRDVTKPVTFDVYYGGTVNAMGGTHAGFKAKTTLNRFDYNLKWDKTTEAGGLVVGKDVDITINIDLKKS